MRKGAIESRHRKNLRRILGVDEVGRGCLAGPVYAAVAAIDYDKLQKLKADRRDLIRDSKQLSAKQRREIIPVLQDVCQEWAIASATVLEIEQHGILGATFIAMKRAYLELKEPYDLLLMDGKVAHPDMPIEQETIIGGDALCYAIAAASIFAKEARDAVMHQAHELYPQYGFASHVGYGTKSHLLALEEFGITPLHRRTFAPIRERVRIERELELVEG